MNTPRAGEKFRDWRAPDDAWVVLRLDGHNFSRFTAKHYEKPFDARFHDAMLAVTRALFATWQSVYAWTASDELSLLLPRECDAFDRRLEKWLSLSAGQASATFTQHSGHVAVFDARAWSGHGGDVAAYFAWRQADAERCALNGVCYWQLRVEGQSASAATRQLEGQSGPQLRALLQERGVNFDAIPSWQRRGVAFSTQTYTKTGYNPITRETVPALRRRARVHDALPKGDEYATFVRALLPS